MMTMFSIQVSDGEYPEYYYTTLTFIMREAFSMCVCCLDIYYDNEDDDDDDDEDRVLLSFQPESKWMINYLELFDDDSATMMAI